MSKYQIYKYKNLIKQCRLIKKKDDYISKATGYDFNIFSILDRERHEVRTHSYFLFELMNRYGKHGQKDIFIKLLLDTVLMIKNYGEIISVKCEDTTSENRRIDFVIECEKIIIGIEMKIDGPDQLEQLYDYDKELNERAKLKTEGRYKLYYLTLSGTEASDFSKKGLKNIENISFQKDIIKWIEKCMEASVSIPILREALYQYLILIEKLTEQKESVMKEIANLLLEDDNLSIAIDMQDAIKEAKVEIQKKFWKALQVKLPEFTFVDYKFNESDIDVLVGKYFSSLSNSDRYYGLRSDFFEIHDEYKIVFYIELHDTLTYGLTISKNNENGKKNVRGEFSVKGDLKNLSEKLGDLSSPTGWWVAEKKINCPKVDFNKFNDFTKEFINPSNNKMEEFIECLSREITAEWETSQKDLEKYFK